MPYYYKSINQSNKLINQLINPLIKSAQYNLSFFFTLSADNKINIFRIVEKLRVAILVTTLINIIDKILIVDKTQI